MAPVPTPSPPAVEPGTGLPAADLRPQVIPRGLQGWKMPASLGCLLFGILLYTALNTLLPSLVFRAPFDVDLQEDSAIHPEDTIAEAALDSPPSRPKIAG